MVSNNPMHPEYQEPEPPEVVDMDDRPHTEWPCQMCGAINSHLDAECQFCDGGVVEPEETPMAYCMAAEDKVRLESVMYRLYDGTTLSYDDRRKLACIMEAVLTSMWEAK